MTAPLHCTTNKNVIKRPNAEIMKTTEIGSFINCSTAKILKKKNEIGNPFGCSDIAYGYSAVSYNGHVNIKF